MPYEPDRHFPAPREYRSNPLPLARRLAEPQQADLRVLIDEVPGRTAETPSYPEQRCRPKEEPALLTDRFDHIETTNGYVSLNDTPTLLISFSGHPNRMEINVEAQDAILQFRKELLTSTPNVTIRAGQTWEPDVNTRHIFASNATAGLIATAQVIGRY